MRQTSGFILWLTGMSGAGKSTLSRALREQLSLSEQADLDSVEFLRFVVRLSEALNRDIPPRDWAELQTLDGCLDYIARLTASASAAPWRAAELPAPA